MIVFFGFCHICFTEYSGLVELPHSVKAVGITFLKHYFGNAFGETNAITEIVLPASLSHIEEGSLSWGDAEITVHPDNPYFTCEDGFLIDTRTSTLLYASASAPDGAIPAVKRIGSRALDNQQLPADLVLPEGVEELSGAAFYDTQVRSVTLPESLRSIGDLGLYCMVDTPVSIPAGCTDIGEDALPMLSDEPWYLND